MPTIQEYLRWIDSQDIESLSQHRGELHMLPASDLEAVASKLAEKMPVTYIYYHGNYPQMQALPEAQARLFAIASSHPDDYLKAYRLVPGIKMLKNEGGILAAAANKAASNHSEAYLKAYQEIAEMNKLPNAAHDLATAASKVASRNPEEYMQAFQNIFDMRILPNAAHDLSAAASKVAVTNPGAYFQYYKDIFQVRLSENAQPDLASAAGKALENDPFAFLDAYQNIPRIRALPDAEKNLSSAAHRLAETDSSSYLNAYLNMPQMRTLPDAKTDLATASHWQAKNNPDAFLSTTYKNIPEVLTLPNAKEDFNTAFSAASGKDMRGLVKEADYRKRNAAVLSYLKDWKGDKEKLLTAAHADPGLAFVWGHNPDLPYQDEMRQAALSHLGEPIIRQDNSSNPDRQKKETHENLGAFSKAVNAAAAIAGSGSFEFRVGKG